MNTDARMHTDFLSNRINLIYSSFEIYFIANTKKKQHCIMRRCYQALKYFK